jgi:hypothetical protein
VASIIPRIKENVRIQPSSPVPVGSGDFARREGEQIENIGGAIMNIGQAMFKADAVSKQSAASEEITTLVNNSKLIAEQTSQSNGADIKQKFQENFDKNIGKIREKYSGNFVANKGIEEFIQNSKVGADDTLTAASLKKLNSFTIDSINKGNESALARIYNNPDPALLQAEIARVNNEVAAYTKIEEETGVSALSVDQGMKLKDNFYKGVAENRLKGLIVKQRFGEALGLLGASQTDSELFNEFVPDQAAKLGFITDDEAREMSSRGEKFKIPTMTKKDKMHTKLTPEEALVMSRLDDGTRQSLTQQLQAKMRERTELRLSDLNAEIAGFEQLAFSPSPVSQQQTSKILNSIVTNPDLPPVAKARLANKVVSGLAVNTQMQQILTVPKAEQGALIERASQDIDKVTKDLIKMNPQLKSMGKDFATQGYTEQAKMRLRSMINDTNKRVAEDPVPFLLGSDANLDMLKRASADAGQTPEGTEALKKYNDTLLAKAQYLGTEQKLLPKNEAVAYADKIKMLPDADETDKYITSLRQTYGEHFPRFMGELMSVDKGLAPMAALTYADPLNSRELVDGIKNKKQIDAEFKVGGKYAKEKNIVEMGVKQEMTPFRRIFVNSGTDTSNLGMIQGLEKAVEIQAKRDIVNNGKMPDIAVKEAYDKVIGSQYHIVDSGRSRVLVPRDLGQGKPMPNPDNINKFIKYNSMPEGLKNLNVAMLKADEKDGLTYDQFLQKDAALMKWSTNATQTGIRLMRTDPITGADRPVRDKFGRIVEKSYEEISLEVPSIDQKNKLNETRLKELNDERFYKGK